MNFERLVAHLQAHIPGLLAVYIFGSQVTDHATAQSDLDVAVLLAGKLDPMRLWEMSGELADIAGIPVDLIDMRAASTIMQYQVITTGLRVWGDDVQVGLFECFVLSEKTELDTARAGLLADIQKDGSIYGR
ncbi:nucleotidyltransferase domain-containing protein [Pseudomonas sp. 10B1]|uniref:type VII toxin-antitoxin system MntA family adenylyltransferase antitoxin n=1 Tax=unclassified Pseudomonas TaxID=196821 RepID=UPI002B2381C0|nr:MULTISPECIES: nucleotidyltransferase domain-containing protein [unclassified Pseudomonas]MEA9995954.1 nucleotidyltransferase domain-containing protein [Pseudomonas sp. AA4]MEB0087664.1 nucleotidyltransferase domain-containing protein [Pseudomonas sp. RTI1]MEB0127755.1 nucleotidyltransferase domain-containing protein [Pseudomonas sp. CCC1.2]MEB0154162.1 nucleotidyltransferase domain-containing protein [Pseudomonas sp. CCC4.3]MEB0220873.1 nucleotidyltransferase domain-containing protein [Pseu